MYQEWLVSGPMERLRLKPTVDPQVAMWPRTERRALAMLMAAVPDNVSNEVVASRMMSTDQLLFKLFICFQPGGASERTKLLHNITDGKCGTQVSEMLDWLRVWRRTVQRAVEFHVTLPDGLVLMGALSKCSDNLSQKSAQVAYRLNMVRPQLGVDHQPVMSSILSYAEYMQAEAEELQLSMPSRPSVSAVKVAAMNIPPGTESKPSEAPKKECKFWMSDSGCRRGDQCKFQHARLDPQSNRCFVCSAVGHTKKECPVRNADTKDDQKKKAAKVKAEGKHEKGSGEKGQKGGKAREDKPATPVAVEVPPGLEGSDQVDGLITEATTLLKSLAPTTSPNVKSVKVKRVSPLEGPTGLLDGRATHPLRRGTPQELSVAEDVVVELAHGSITLKQHPITGTIFSDRAIEPIVPLRSLIELNYSIRWSSSGCEIRHPTRGTIECWLRNGCPTVTEQNALSLIADIERLKMPCTSDIDPNQ